MFFFFLERKKGKVYLDKETSFFGGRTGSGFRESSNLNAVVAWI